MAKFSKYLLVFDVGILLILSWPVYTISGKDVLFSIIVAFTITTVLAIASYFPFTRIGNDSMNSYMAAMLAGMLLRMLFIGLSIAIVFIFTEMHQTGFTVGLLFSYICKSVIETYILTQKQKGQTSAA
ncbi:MAG: hypothetical protein WD097_08135 [Balneolales bacterium]